MSCLDEVKLLVKDRNIDVLCVSETWLNENTPDAYINIPGYTIFRCDNGRGAGVCIYVCNSLTSSIIVFNVPRQAGVEDVWVQMQCRKLPAIIIGCVHRHPKALAASFEYIQEVFRMVCLRNKSVFILGDFNDDVLIMGNKISKIIKNNNLTQVIDKATRSTSTSATLLDLIVTNMPDVILAHDVVPLVIADHDLVSIVINVCKPRKQAVTRTTRNFKYYDKDILCSLLCDNIHFMYNIFLTDDVDKQVCIFNDVFINCLDMCAPITTKVVRRRPIPWMNDDIREAMKSRNDLQKQFKLDLDNSLLREQYKAAKDSVKVIMRNAKTEYYHDRLKECKGNTSSTWKVIEEIIPNKKSKDKCHNFDNPCDKAEEFNKFFSSVGESTFKRSQEELSKEDEYVIDSPHFNVNVNTAFRPEPVDTDTVILTIKNLKTTSSAGSDGITLQFIRDALPVILPFLTCVINTSLVTGVFPAAWKHALVVPLYKNGDPDSVNNYRPVSILPVVSKILEKIVAKQLTCYLETKKLFSNSQHGFRCKLSTETALTTITDQLYTNMDNKKVSLLTLCDLSKAFDSVNHNTLLNKLSQLNIDEFWFSNYLSNRSMSVRLTNNMSKKIKISYGVPQGSILGPILFGVYVNDLSAHVNCFPIQYADDTQFLHSNTLHNLEQLIRDTEDTLLRCRKYFLRNGLMLNSSKTQCIFIGNRQLLANIPPDTTIKCNGDIIYPSKHVKNLGLYIDRYMLFDVHINELNRKVMGIVMYISRISHNFDKKTRIIIIQALVLSLVEYCIKIWGTTNNTLISSVQKLQNFSARVAVGGVRKYEHVSAAFMELKWLKVKQKHLLDVGITVGKVLRGFYPDWFLSFPSVEGVAGSVTRQRQQLHVPRTNTHTGDRCTTVLGATLWNTLPLSLKQSPTLTIFKTRLKEFLLTVNM